jgi:hypothetical protein
MNNREIPKDIGLDTPLRLDVAARVAFPSGGMTASGLRREAARGRLQIERIAGKDYTTLAAACSRWRSRPGAPTDILALRLNHFANFWLGESQDPRQWHRRR